MSRLLRDLDAALAARGAKLVAIRQPGHYRVTVEKGGRRVVATMSRSPTCAEHAVANTVRQVMRALGSG